MLHILIRITTMVYDALWRSVSLLVMNAHRVLRRAEVFYLFSCLFALTCNFAHCVFEGESRVVHRSIAHVSFVVYKLIG
jgi:hypothetical protein